MIKGFFMAWGCFTAIPCPIKKWDESCRKWMLATLPVIGIFLGLIWLGLFMVLKSLNIPTEISAGIMTVYPFLITGGIHLEGYLDCCDAIYSRLELKEKQRILKDSSVGAFAVIFALLFFVMYFSAMIVIVREGILAKPIYLILVMTISRSVAVWNLFKEPAMETSQYKNISSKENLKYVSITVFIIFIAVAITMTTLVFTGSIIKWSYLVALIILVCLIAYTVAFRGRKNLGGMNGDIAGCTITVSELAGVLLIGIC